MTPFSAPADYAKWQDVAALIHTAFAYMEPLLGHPARAASITPQQLAEAAAHGTAYLIEHGARPVACLFTRPSRDVPGALYLGWLAVEAATRGQGLAHHLIAAAEAEARTKGHAALTLDTGTALKDLHTFFRRAGFEDWSCAGDIITFRKSLA